MNDEHEQRRRPRWGAATIIVVLVLALYVLSYGPAYALTTRGNIEFNTLETVYYPLHWLGERNETVGNALSWYVGKWLPDAVPACPPG